MKSFSEVFRHMQQHQMKTPQTAFTMSIPHARQTLGQAMSYFLALEGRQMQWLPEYDEVADWLSDNRGRGLFLYGNCGRGKSLLIRYVIPAILLKCCRKVVNVYDMQEMNAKPDVVMTKSLIALDDVGTEEVVVNYGNRRLAFAEIMDAAEKQKKLLLISSNLDKQHLLSTYGDRTFDRIRSTTRRVLFRGDSLRQ